MTDASSTEWITPRPPGDAPEEGDPHALLEELHHGEEGPDATDPPSVGGEPNEPA